MRKDLFEFQAEVCKTFSNPRRLKILDLLKAGEQPVSHLIRALGASKANTSQHLAVLRLTGILKTRRDGSSIYYRIANDNLARACSLMQDALMQVMESEQKISSDEMKRIKENVRESLARMHFPG